MRHFRLTRYSFVPIYRNREISEYFVCSQNKWSVSTYPVYHSVHDSFHWMKYFVDHEFEYHRTLTQLWLQVGLTLAEQPLLPFNSERYADRLTYYAKDIKTKYEKILTQQYITLGKSATLTHAITMP